VTHLPDPGTLVSVIVPTIGRRARLERTIQTLLNQTLDPRFYEVIIADDASSETYEWLPDRVRLVRRTARGGAGGARNAGLAEAAGEFVAFTDDDCLVPSEWLSSFLDAFRRFPSASAVGGPLMPDPSHLHTAAARLERRLAMDYYRSLHVDPIHDDRLARADVSPAWGTNNLAWRAAPLKGLGGFLEGTSKPEDRDLALRAGAAGHLAVFIPLVVRHNRAYSWTDLWRRSEYEGRGKGRGRPVTALARCVARLPRALAHDLRLVSTRDPALFAAAVVRDVALSASAARAATSRGGHRDV
jgi:glycosyltransferase involved in cell wall biosynthesis